MNWLLWELKRTFRGRAFVWSALLLCLFIGASFVYGRTLIARQKIVINDLDRLITESDQVYFQERFKDGEEVGRACYYLSQPTAHIPLPEATLSLGQRDLHSYHQIVRLRTLYAHLFDSGFSNPSQAAAGHFDLAFVLVFLLPLLVIALTFDTLSSDAERRTLPMLRANELPIGTLVAGRLAVRFALLAVLVSSLVASSLWACGAPLPTYPAWLSATLSYLLIWFSLAGLVCSRGWNSAMNAGALLALWTVLTVLGPALLNLALPRDAVKNGASITIRARQIVNDGWDTDKRKTAAVAEKLDPRYRDAPVVQEKFTWSWYFAMHDAGDAAVEEMAREYFQGLEQRYDRSLSWSLLFPPVRLQLLLDEFASTDLRTHLRYYQFVKEAREEMRTKFLPRVFSGETLSKNELLQLHEELPVRAFQPTRARLWSAGLFQLMGLSLCLAVFALLSLSRVEGRLKG